MGLTSAITLETVSVPLASSVVETRKGGGVQNNASDKTKAAIQWCSSDRRLCGWCMRMMPCGHLPNARSHEITIHITTVGLAQARPNDSCMLHDKCRNRYSRKVNACNCVCISKEYACDCRLTLNPLNCRLAYADI